jgi:ubiquinone biosynthesis protein
VPYFQAELNHDPTSMLTARLIPTPLIQPGESAPILIDRNPPRVRFRMAYVGLHVLLLCLRIFWLSVTGRLSHERLGDLLRDYCQRMGVIWIKVGQLLSMRADLAPAGVRTQLAKLFDRVQGFPGDQAVRLLEAELGTPVEDVFSDFERVPLAAASIAQVHRARLKREKILVAVKVRRPNILYVSARDMAVVRLLVWLMETIGFMPQGRWRDMLWELEEAIREELDYRFEASNMRRIKKNLCKHGIYVPSVFCRYSTSAVLVMEFIQGVLMADYLRMAQSDPERLGQWREANGMKPYRVARQLVHSLFRQTFEENLFHGDLHPGNIVLLRNSRIAFLDFGSLGSMERDLSRKVDQYMQALGERQYSKVVDIFFLFSPSLPSTNLSDCKSEMIRRLLAWDIRNRVPDLPFTEKSFNAIQDEMVLFAATYGVAPVWTFFRMTRALTTMDASLRELIPESNFHVMVASYFHRRMNRMPGEMAAKFRQYGPNLNDWLELQDRMSDDMKFRGTIVRRAAQVFEETSSQIALFFARIFAQVANLFALTGIILFLAFLLQHGRGWLTRLIPDWAESLLDRLPPLDVQVWVLLFAGLLYSHYRFVSLSRRFRKENGEGSGGE